MLFLDFRHQGQRCREQTALPDTPSNRRRLQRLLADIETEMLMGAFNYAERFPGSANAVHFLPAVTELAASIFSAGAVEIATPRFADFADEWFAENELRWRKTYRRTILDILTLHLKPAFGERVVGQISKADILKFRSTLGKVKTRNRQKELSASRINYVMMALRQILSEAADRFNFNTPFRNIKPLKVPKSDVEPFTLDEVKSIIDNVRADFRNYYVVRFFTGMRTGEIDGLRWEYVDFERRLIRVRQTIVKGDVEYTKTDASQRDIQMSGAVYEVLRDQEAASRRNSEYVFCSKDGAPLQHNNVSKRVWYPLLRYLGLKRRRPYQTRHTAATLWLASGENPQWISRQLGHSSSEMLFKVYSRFVPNLTRQDGSAFERLLVQSGAAGSVVIRPKTNEGHLEVINERA